MAITDPNARLEMHVIGSSKGESIVLKLPTGGWGVVIAILRRWMIRPAIQRTSSSRNAM